MFIACRGMPIPVGFLEADYAKYSFQPGKSLYTTVRELVENSLDSAESISELPIVQITIEDSEEIGRSMFNSMIGLADHERVDEELYDDFETIKAHEPVKLMATEGYITMSHFLLSSDVWKRLAKEARLQEIQAKNAYVGKKVKTTNDYKALEKSRGLIFSGDLIMEEECHTMIYQICLGEFYPERSTV